MATIWQIRGMLLEEALLYLLRITGYSTVEDAGSDPTLHNGHSGLEVLGRGSRHQIDAVADFLVAQPFSHPQRLLVEAKCYSENHPVELRIIRNAVGVLRDVCEYWIPPIGNAAPKHRYHYQYALFSASGYTINAEKYAFVQDIYLIPLARSSYIAPIIRTIRNLSHESFCASKLNKVNINLSALRRSIRKRIRNEQETNLHELVPEDALPFLEEFCRSCQRIGSAILAMIAKRFPVFLVPGPGVHLDQLQDFQKVRIFWDEQGWYLQSIDGRNLFSFDLPPNLFELYAEQGVLTATRAIELKAEVLSEFQTVLMVNDHIRVITLRLDTEWLSQVRDRLSEIHRRREQDRVE